MSARAPDAPHAIVHAHPPGRPIPLFRMPSGTEATAGGAEILAPETDRGSMCRAIYLPRKPRFQAPVQRQLQLCDGHPAARTQAGADLPSARTPNRIIKHLLGLASTTKARRKPAPRHLYRVNRQVGCRTMHR
jgi:hypothetical protein